MNDRRTRGRILRTAVAAATLVALAAPAAAQTQPPPSPCRDPEDPAFSTYECKVERLRERSFVVVALVDSGINPYHADFRVPAGDDLRDVPPWEFIEGYPTTADPLDLTLEAESYEEAVAADSEVWNSAQAGRLYHVPGTKIVGAYPDPSDWSRWGATPVLDDHGHGTSSASVAAGAIHGSAPDPEILVVMVEGIGSNAFRWAASQPWIDVVTNSWGYLADLYFLSDEHETSRQATDEGKSILFSAGNGASGTALACDRAITATSATAGPSWIISVGAVSPRSGQAYCWHSIPPDVSSYGLHWPAAQAGTLEGEREFGGTSNASPVTAGVIAAQILEARRVLGDVLEGPHAGGVLAAAAEGISAPAAGPLADGDLTGVEVRETTEKTAFPEDFTVEGLQEDLKDCDPADPTSDECLFLSQNLTYPTTPAYFVYQGYGIVNAESRDRALEVLLGNQPMPDRTEVDAWMLAKRAAADVIWESILAAS